HGGGCYRAVRQPAAMPQGLAKVAGRVVDVLRMLVKHSFSGGGLPRPAPMANAERQAKFRAAHPGYNKKYRGPSARQLRQAQLARARAAAAAAAAAAANNAAETAA